MSDNTVDILIRTKAELAGAEQTAASMQRAITSAKLLGEETAELERNYAKLTKSIADYKAQEQQTTADSRQLSDAMQRQVDASKLEQEALGENTGAAHENSLSKKEIRELTHHLTRDTPVLGEVLRAIRNPWVGLGVAIGATVGKMIEYEQQEKEMLTRPGPDWETKAAEIQELKKGYADAAVELAKYIRETERIQNKPATPQERGDARIEILKANAAAETDLLAKQKEEQEAAIDELEQLGVINHGQALAQKFKLDEEYAKKRVDLENRTQQAELAQRRTELRDDRDQAGFLDHTIHGSLAGDSAKANAAVKKNAIVTDQAKSNLDKALEERQKLQDDINTIADRAGHGDSATVGIAIAKKLGFNVNTAAEAQKLLEDRAATIDAQIATLRKLVNRGETAAPGLQNIANKADEDLKEAQENLKALLARIHELSLLIPKDTAKAGADAANRGASATADSTTRAIKETGAIIADPGALADASAGATALSHGQKATDNQNNMIGALVTVLQTLHLTQQQALAEIAAAQGNLAGQQKLIEDLKRANVQLASRIKSSFNP